MDSESKRLGENLKMIRTKKGISQGDIARSLGVSRGYISNIENGKTNPTLATIVRLASALGVKSDELLK
jgi:transcriptional regulator with XRE-family HTH domain